MTDPDPVSTWIQNGGSVATAVGVLIALGVAVWWEPRKQRTERSERAQQGIEDAKRHREQLAEMRRAENDRLAAQARRVIVTLTKADVLVENLWHIRIDNTSTDAVTGLRVNVTAVDDAGRAVPDGCRRAHPGDKGAFADAGAATLLRTHQTVLKRIRQDFDDFVRHIAETYGAFGGDGRQMLETYMNGMPPWTLDEASAAALKEQVKQSIALQIGDDWPRYLAPGGFAIVGYQTDSAQITPQTELWFSDFSGYVWHRTDAKLERVTEPVHELDELERQPEVARKHRWWSPKRWFAR